MIVLSLDTSILVHLGSISIAVAGCTVMVSVANPFTFKKVSTVFPVLVNIFFGFTLMITIELPVAML